MEIWFTSCLSAVAIILIVFRDSQVVESVALGIFAGLVMISTYPFMPIVAKGVAIPLTLSITKIMIREMGWLIVIFPVSMFFLSYFHRFPMEIFVLFKTVLIFTICYNIALGLIIFRSMLMMVLLNLLVFSITFIGMLCFGWIVRGCQYIDGNWTPRGDGIDEKGAPF